MCVCVCVCVCVWVCVCVCVCVSHGLCAGSLVHVFSAKAILVWHLALSSCFVVVAVAFLWCFFSLSVAACLLDLQTYKC